MKRTNITIKDLINISTTGTFLIVRKLTENMENQIVFMSDKDFSEFQKVNYESLNKFLETYGSCFVNSFYIEEEKLIITLR